MGAALWLQVYICVNYPIGESNITQLEAQDINSSQRRNYPAVRLKSGDSAVCRVLLTPGRADVVCTASSLHVMRHLESSLKSTDFLSLTAM